MPICALLFSVKQNETNGGGTLISGEIAWATAWNGAYSGARAGSWTGVRSTTTSQIDNRPLVALGALLLHFPVWGRKDVEGCWWARRSADADLELQLVLREPMLCEEPMLPTIVAARQNEHAGTTVLLTLAE